MRDIRVTFSVASSLATPLQADTLFGHFCWAIAYTEGEEKLTEFLQAFDDVPPLLVSDGFPALADDSVLFLPSPALPGDVDDLRKIESVAGVDADSNDKTDARRLHSALKTLKKKKWLSQSAYTALSGRLSSREITLDYLKLKLCPASGMQREDIGCNCPGWRECPGIMSATKAQKEDAIKKYGCHLLEPQVSTSLTMHNVINRLGASSENLFTTEESFPGCRYYFLARIDEQLVDEPRLRRWMEYIQNAGYGRDASTGKGALRDVTFSEFNWPHSQAQAFLNLSSAYVPGPGELDKAWYEMHVKRGKLGGDFALTNSPWKKPVIMLKAGAIVVKPATGIYGRLVKGIHYERPEVVQYGYAFPLGVDLNV